MKKSIHEMIVQSNNYKLELILFYSWREKSNKKEFIRYLGIFVENVFPIMPKIIEPHIPSQLLSLHRNKNLYSFHISKRINNTKIHHLHGLAGVSKTQLSSSSILIATQWKYKEWPLLEAEGLVQLVEEKQMTQHSAIRCQPLCIDMSHKRRL